MEKPWERLVGGAVVLGRKASQNGGGHGLQRVVPSPRRRAKRMSREKVDAIRRVNVRRGAGQRVFSYIYVVTADTAQLRPDISATL